MIRAALSAGAMLFASVAAAQFGSSSIRARGALVIFLTPSGQIVPEVFIFRPECGPGPSKLRPKRRRI
jgi:hypothetical protein